MFDLKGQNLAEGQVGIEPLLQVFDHSDDVECKHHDKPEDMIALKGELEHCLFDKQPGRIASYLDLVTAPTSP